jgi:Kef-type K+ transport system membrane component KefB
MRWVVKVFALSVTMAVLHRLAAAGPLEARAALALGFLLCAAWLGAGFARGARVPQVTGFLLLGFCIGPAWLNFVHADEVDALALIADAGLGLVMLAAGAALSVRVLRRERVAIARLAIGTVAFPFVAVALVTLSVGRWFPLTMHQRFGSVLVAALALAAVAVTSSPALTATVMDEPGAPEGGLFARALLEVTVVKDLIAVVLVALVLTLGGWIGSAGALRGGLGIVLLGRALASLAGGVVLGVLLDHYVSLPRSDGAVALGAFAFAATLLARLLDLDGILVALAAGCVAANLSPDQGARLRAAWRHASLPVYAVSFTLMGAGLRVQVLADIWPWALLLAGLRVVTLRYGTRWAGRRPEVPRALAEDGWLALISQAGVVLVLAAAIRRAFPAWGVSFETLVATMVAVHALIGPVLLRRTLARAEARRDEERRADVGEVAVEPLRVIPVS